MRNIRISGYIANMAIAPSHPALTAPKAKRVPSNWPEKIHKATKAREAGKEARRGKPVAFPHSFTLR